MTKCKQYTPIFKAKVALEALKGERMVSELASRFGLYPTMIHQWKKVFLDGASDIFERGGMRKAPPPDAHLPTAPNQRSGQGPQELSLSAQGHEN